MKVAVAAAAVYNLLQEAIIALLIHHLIQKMS